MLLSTAFCPPVPWFAAAAAVCNSGTACHPERSRRISLEACESYRKQTWRNRCRILSATGPEDISFPIVHDGARLITAIRIDNSVPWVRKAEKAIDTAYGSSPFFEYYRDDFFAAFESAALAPEARLWDLNLSLIRFFADKLHLPLDIVFTETFDPSPDEPDLRDAFSPKRPGIEITGIGTGLPYWQPFSRKLGFIPGLSIMDLLFNEGPESSDYL